MESLTAGGATLLGLAALTLSVSLALLKRAFRAPAPPSAPSDAPWGQRWPRFRKDLRRGPLLLGG